MSFPPSFDGEPWVDIPNADSLENWSKPEEIKYNQNLRQSEKYYFFRNSFDCINENGIIGDYYEFGCHRARTFRMALSEARRHNIQSMDFYAFDSFQGLPTATSNVSHNIWQQAGTLATSEADFYKIVDAHGLYHQRIHSIPGFYDQSLTPSLAGDFKAKNSKAALITVDCDLYESACPVFTFIEDFIQEGTILYIDDLFVGYKGSPLQGVARAFLEYQERSRFHFIRHLNVGWWGRSYIAYLNDPDTKLDPSRL